MPLRSPLCLYRTEGRCMDVSEIRPGIVVDGRRVVSVRDSHEVVWGRRGGRNVAMGTQAVRLVRLAGESKDRRFVIGKSVTVSGYAERLPSGPVPSKVGHRRRTGANDGHWRGESGKLGELRTWQHD